MALSTVLPGTKDCTVTWKGRINRFVDCHGDQHRSFDLDRYEDFIDPAGREQGDPLRRPARTEAPGRPATSQRAS